MLSMHRETGNVMWFEFLFGKQFLDLVKKQLSNWELEYLSLNELSQSDRDDWFYAFHKTNSQLRALTLARTTQLPFDDSNRNEVLGTFWKEINKQLEIYTVAPVYHEEFSNQWYFIPNNDLAGKSIRWHPILSNYLMSFALATILRYQPQLVKGGTTNHFLSQAWCSQSARTTLGYFLMLFTDPPITIQTI